MIYFLKYKWVYFILSLSVILPGLVSLGLYGLKPGIDFTGGSLYEFRLSNQTISPEEIKGEVQKVLTDTPIQSAIQSGPGQYVLKMAFLDDSQRVLIKNKLNEKYGNVEDIRFDVVGPTMGREILIKTATAGIIAALSMILFITLTFKNLVFGISAVIATFHDTLVILGVFSLLGHFANVEVDSLFIAAVLTILSFSVHDTIVVFDRIREGIRTSRSVNFTHIANKALNETMVRSINNSLTIIFMLLSLMLLGGVTVRYFVLALLIGTISGTYSSPFVAVPLLDIIMHWKNKHG